MANIYVISYRFARAEMRNPRNSCWVLSLLETTLLIYDLVKCQGSGEQACHQIIYTC